MAPGTTVSLSEDPGLAFVALMILTSLSRRIGLHEMDSEEEPRAMPSSDRSEGGES